MNIGKRSMRRYVVNTDDVNHAATNVAHLGELANTRGTIPCHICVTHEEGIN